MEGSLGGRCQCSWLRSSGHTRILRRGIHIIPSQILFVPLSHKQSVAFPPDLLGLTLCSGQTCFLSVPGPQHPDWPSCKSREPGRLPESHREQRGWRGRRGLDARGDHCPHRCVTWVRPRPWVCLFPGSFWK